MKCFLILLGFLTISLGTSSQVLDINKGRQLLVDDMFIQHTDLERVFHSPAYYNLNPVLTPDRQWEINAKGDPYAAPFSGGVWYDELDSKYKMWYSAGGGKTDGLITCYAESNDGKNWFKPDLDVVPNTNIVDTTEHDCVSVLLDKHEQDPQKRFKMFVVAFNTPASVSMLLKYSSDGIHWSAPEALSGEIYDRCAAYYDPFKKQYVLSLKTLGEYRRSRNYLSHKDPAMAVSLAHRTYDTTSDKFIKYWFHADDDDPRHPDFPEIRPQIYNHEAMPYESLTLGYFTIWQGPENDVCDELKIQKRNEVLVGWSRDGFEWNRDNKTAFLPVSDRRDEWNAANVQSTAGSPIIVGDSLYFYVSGRYDLPKWDSNFSTGLATLRRDGFASLEAVNNSGFVITKPVSFEGNYMFVNADIKSKGSLRVELLDEKGTPIQGYTEADCIPMNEDSTKHHIRWENHDDVSELKGQPIQMRITLSGGSHLYSFWVSETKEGMSGGYTAGGGPGLHSSGFDI